MYYNHITINERACIYVFLKNGMSIREIAKALSRNPSTISREIKRNSHRVNHLYHPEAAQRKYDGRRLICHRKKNNNISPYNNLLIEGVSCLLDLFPYD